MPCFRTSAEPGSLEGAFPCFLLLILLRPGERAMAWRGMVGGGWRGEGGG